MPEKSEIAIFGLFRSRARIQCPAVHIVGIPNAGKRGQWALNQAMREGMALGFPDCVCLWPGGGFAAIEWKKVGGKTTKNQEEWIDRLRSMGFHATVMCDADVALLWLRGIGAPFSGRAIAETVI